MQLVESHLFITEGQVILKCDKDSDFPYVVYVCLQKLRIIRAIRVIQIKPASPNNSHSYFSLPIINLISIDLQDLVINLGASSKTV